jgi:hypothetical protein
MGHGTHSAAAMIAAPAKTLTRIYPQMPQMFTDEERICVHLCHLWTKFPPLSHGERGLDRNPGQRRA